MNVWQKTARLGSKIGMLIGACLILGGCFGDNQPDALDVSIVAMNNQAPDWAYGAEPRPNCTGGYGCGAYPNRNQVPARRLDAQNTQALETSQAAIQELRTLRGPEQNTPAARLQRSKELAKQVLVMRGLQRGGCPSGSFFGQPRYEAPYGANGPGTLTYTCAQANGWTKEVSLPVDYEGLLKSDSDLDHNQLLKMEQELERQQQAQQ